MKIKLNVRPYGKIEAEVYRNIFEVRNAGFELDRIVRDSIMCDYMLFTKYTRTDEKEQPTIKIEFAVVPYSKINF